MSLKIGVIGLGAWGSALLLHLAKNNHSVVGWGRRIHSEASTVSVAGSCFPLPAHAGITDEISKLNGLDALVVAVPAKALSSLELPSDAKFLISATKGIEPTTLQTPLTFFSSSLGYAPEVCCVLSGPSFASDLAAGRPISVVAASHTLSAAEQVVDIFGGRTMRVYSSDDPIGVELGGILKNVIALAAGVSDALELGPSARAALITRGLAEITRLAVALGAQPSTLAGLSGLGDLLMTASDDQSRNRSVGLRLGKGEPIDTICRNLGSVAEGVFTAPLVLTLANKVGIDVPICQAVVSLLEGKMTALEMVESLMNRPRKKEF